jgi:hypothetical protein
MVPVASMHSHGTRMVFPNVCRTSLDTAPFVNTQTMDVISRHSSSRSSVR